MWVLFLLLQPLVVVLEVLYYFPCSCVVVLLMGSQLPYLIVIGVLSTCCPCSYFCCPSSLHRVTIAVFETTLAETKHYLSQLWAKALLTKLKISSAYTVE